jgi:hypothetical protein
VVAEILLPDPTDPSAARFHYLVDQPDYQAAERAGFRGFPAFKKEAVGEGISQGVIEALMRRLPPRKREDFSEYLELHRLPSPFAFSDYALLGYTGARLPSDGFALVAEFRADQLPCDYLVEVVGIRHVFKGDLKQVIEIGGPVNFVLDHANPFDPNAIKVIFREVELGFINRAFARTFLRWHEHGVITATIERINGRPDRPVVYLRLEARPK